MRNKTENSRTADGKSHCPKLPMKRDRSHKTDTPPNRELTQTRALGDKKRCKTASSKNSAKESSSDESSLRKTKKCIGRFFYESGLDFDAVNLPSFEKMISSLCSSEQTKRQIPTCQELKGWIFEDVMKEMHEYVDEIRNSWAETGCSILLDGWTDDTGRDLINVIVDCPRGAVYLCSYDISDCVGNMDAMLSLFDRVLTEVGIENVIQIITYSASPFMKELGQKIMEKYQSTFWTVSASYCVELMLEKMKGIDVTKETLEKMKIITRFFSHPIALKFLRDEIDGCDLVPLGIKSTLPFLVLENIVLAEEILKKMFLSSDLKWSSLVSTEEGKRVAGLISDRSFWSGALTTIQAAIPLVKAIEWLNETNKEQVAYIYETIDQVKETIKKGFKSTKSHSQYSQFWKAIDEVWTETLYSPLHSGGYFFNPNFFYSSDVYIDPEVATGVLCCIVRAARDSDIQDRICDQMEKYRTATGAFALGCSGDQKYDVSPVLWWSKYGTDCPELQRVAVRILSQTCEGASRFRLKRSLAETLFTKAKNCTERKKLADMVFVRYNMHLKNIASGKVGDVIASDDIFDLTDKNAQNNASDGGSTTDQGIVDLVEPSCFHPKVEKGMIIDLDGPSPSRFRPKEETK